MTYGVPYCGSKNAIAKRLVDCLPPAETFVDLFAGGCAVTHAAILSGKYKRFIINDINPMPTELFVNAVQGRYRDEKRWISREDFYRLRDSDPIVAYCWSFANNPNNGYMYSHTLEPIKKALHYKRVFGDDSLYNELMKDPTHSDAMQGVRRLQSLESLERLECLERLERLAMDYREVPLPSDCVVYCDIPYKGTWRNYNKGLKFDHEAFYEWASRHECYISEYEMPVEFECVAEIQRTVHTNGKGACGKAVEKLFYSKGE